MSFVFINLKFPSITQRLLKKKVVKAGMFVFPPISLANSKMTVNIRKQALCGCLTSIARLCSGLRFVQSAAIFAEQISPAELKQNFWVYLWLKTTEIIVFSYINTKKVSLITLSLSLTPKNQVGNLAVIMDSDRDFIRHIQSVTFNLDETRLRPIQAFVSSRLDYCNGLLTDLSKRAVKHLQYIWNAASRVLTWTRNCDYISPVLRSLHLFPVAQRTDFKAAPLVKKLDRSQLQQCTNPGWKHSFLPAYMALKVFCFALFVPF